MIIIEPYVKRKGRMYVRSYSDMGYYIMSQDGTKYEEAIDPEDRHRRYRETTEFIIREASLEEERRNNSEYQKTHNNLSENMENTFDFSSVYEPAPDEKLLTLMKAWDVDETDE